MSKLRATERKALPDGKFVFPTERKLPLEDKARVRSAIARFDQVEGDSEAQRNAAWKRIESAETRFGDELGESSWRALGRRR